MRRTLLLLFALGFLGCSVSGGSPEPFAREVVAAVAAADFDRYWALSSQTMDALAGSDARLPAQGLGATLAPMQMRSAHEEFDRLLRSGRIRSGDSTRLEPVVVATELERWTLELFDPEGRGVGIQIYVRKWNEGYRLLRMYTVEPGRARDAVTVVEG